MNGGLRAPVVSPTRPAEDAAGASTVARLAEMRELAYGFLSGIFLRPDDDHVRALVAAVPELQRRSRPFSDLASAPSWGALLDAVGGITDESRETMAAEYASLLVMGAAEGWCSPCESANSKQADAEAGSIRSRLQLTYSLVGLSPVATEEPSDHLAVELEFMSVLCSEEARAWQTEHPDEAGTWLRRQSAFLDAHLLRWLPRFDGRLCRVAPASLYSKLVREILTYASHDRELSVALADRIASVTQARP